MKRFLRTSAAVLLAAAPALAGEPEIGKKAPDFTATQIIEKGVAKASLYNWAGKFIVLEWTNPGCPFVKKHYDSGNMQALQKKWTGKGVAWLSICSSAKGKQGFLTPEEWRGWIAQAGAAPTALLLDSKGTAGKRYGAKTTPHMFVIDPKGVLIYKGAIDDHPTYDPKDIEGAVNYVDRALEEAMEGKPVSEPSVRSYGCSVKYE